jgi:hypothetical protein
MIAGMNLRRCAQTDVGYKMAKRVGWNVVNLRPEGSVESVRWVIHHVRLQRAGGRPRYRAPYTNISEALTAR